MPRQTFFEPDMPLYLARAPARLDSDGLASRTTPALENFVVGAPCGIMDQMASACGLENNLFAILCQHAELVGSVPLPPEIGVWGIDSGVRHAVTGSDYNSVRVEAFMGYRIIADKKGLVPTQQRGGHKLDRYGDKRSTQERNYPVRQPTAHPIYEPHRVQLFRALLERCPYE